MARIACGDNEERLHATDISRYTDMKKLTKINRYVKKLTKINRGKKLLDLIVGNLIFVDDEIVAVELFRQMYQCP